MRKTEQTVVSEDCACCQGEETKKICPRVKYLMSKGGKGEENEGNGSIRRLRLLPRRGKRRKFAQERNIS